MSSDSSKSKNSIPQIKPWSSLQDRSLPLLSRPSVWAGHKDNLELSHRVTRAILAVLREKAAMKCEAETVKSATQDGGTTVFKPDPYDCTQCDRCGQHKQSVRSRTTITIGRESGTVRCKFCDECAALWSFT